MNDEVVACPLCSDSEHEILFDLRSVPDRFSVPGRVARCRRCSMWFKILSDSGKLSDVYGEEYAAVSQVDDYLGGEAARAFFRKVLCRIEIAKGPRPKLLDIGAGQGTLLEEAQALGYEAQGIDRCEPLVRKAQARGLRVECRRAEDLAADGKFDVVTMMDVIEHVPEPRRLLATAYALLKKGGRVVVYTPNHRAAVVSMARALHRVGVSFAVREIFGGNHVCFFDDHSLPLALGAAGFFGTALELFPFDPHRPGQPISPVSLATVAAIEWIGRPFNRVFRMLAVGTK